MARARTVPKKLFRVWSVLNTFIPSLTYDN
jgi:hypothetical protein